MRLVHSQPRVPTKAEVMRDVFSRWANETAAQNAGREVIDLLGIVNQRDALTAADWQQIKSLTERLVRERRVTKEG